MAEKIHRVARWVMEVPDTGLKTSQRKLNDGELEEWENTAKTVKCVTIHEGSVVGTKEKSRCEGPWVGSNTGPLNRPTWARYYATKGSPHAPRNELLAVGYMENMKMGVSTLLCSLPALSIADSR